LKPEEAHAAADDLAKIFSELTIVKTRELREDVMEIALTQKMTIYDALYIAAAKKSGGTLYTADQKLHTAACKISNSALLKPAS
jgi:predicted nucleic acid-binding protein